MKVRHATLLFALGLFALAARAATPAAPTRRNVVLLPMISGGAM